MKSVCSLFLIFLAHGQISAQCISLQNCLSTLDACDYTANNSVLWNETYWFDPVNQTSDLADTPIESSLTVTDQCASASIRYLLFLDLDKNGSWETVVKSWEPPAAGTINFNNWNNPNFDGGTVQIFDERPVPANQKYQFTIETFGTGDTTRAYLRWNTPDAPNTFVNVELPYATHKIKWLVEDTLGNNQTCEHPIVVKDCKKPTVVCLNGLSVNVMPTGEISIWASDFLQYGEDNATPTNFLKYSIRKCGAGSGFPENPDGSPKLSVTFSCTELGPQCVELWVKDASGNADFCETSVIVQDDLGNCPGGGGNDSIPTIVCLNGLSVNILPSGEIQLWTSDLLHYAEDDNTPVNLLEFGIQPCASGNTFPVDGNGDPIQNIIFDCSELGNQCTELWVRDEDGNTAYCQVQVIITDNYDHCPGNGLDVAPTVVCLNGLSVNIMPTGLITLWASDFLQYADDDNTPFNLLQFSLRKSGTGTGFPIDSVGNAIQSLIYDCDELGTNAVELWAKDLDGNADYCETYVIVQDNMEICPEQVTLDVNTSPGEGGAIILTPQPNPTSSVASIPVRLVESGPVRIEITDLSGKTLWANTLNLNAGSHLLEIAPEAIKQAGVYVWRVQTASKSASGKLVKI